MIHRPTRRKFLSIFPFVFYGQRNKLGRKFGLSTPETVDWPIEQRIGSTHVDPGYHFTEQNILNEGAAKLESLGTEVIKVWFHLENEKYPYNSNWTSFDTLIERAEHEYFQELFERPFKTYQLSTFSEPSDVDGHYFRHGMGEDDIEDERSQFYDLTRYLLETYDGTGKEFVLKNWESDWAIRGDFNPEIQPGETALNGMVEWFNARQLGVTQARDDINSDVTVLNAAEVNHPLMEQTEEMDLVTTAVLPETNVDVVSYSAHELIPFWDEPPNPNNDDGRGDYSPPAFVDFVFETLDFINDHAPHPSPYVQQALIDPTKNVFIGEYGIPEDVRGTRQQYRFTKVLTEAALYWGSRWSIFWQLYDNEGHGWWLINKEGERLPVYNYFEEIFENERTPSRPMYDRLDIEFGRLIDDRAFQCFTITLLDQEDEVIQSFDIGVPMDEPVIWNGAFWKEEKETDTFRWFGGNQGRTEIYFEEGILQKSNTIMFYGRPREPGIDASVYLNGEKTDERYLEGWDPKEWKFEFDSVDQPTPATTPTPTTDETPTSTPSNEGLETPTTPISDHPTATASPTDRDTIPGPGIMGSVASLVGAGYLMKWWVEKQEKNEIRTAGSATSKD